MGNIHITIGRKEAVFFTLAIAIVISGLGVIAYNSGGPASTFGHDAGELEGVIREGVLLTLPVTVYDDTANSNSFFDAGAMASNPAPPADIKEVLLKTYLKTDPAYGSSAKFEYWLAISPPMNPQTISSITNENAGTEESTLTWLPLTDSGTFQYRCSVSGANSRCRVKVFGFR